MPKSITVRTEGLVLDEILAKEFGPVTSRSQRMLEATLATNPGLADLGPVLPIGAVLVLPDKPAADAVATQVVVSLFG
ncbi:tail protein [Aurantimonas phage AmM-1]|uniref:baseplate hub n=1 Tax=Aurantimonas phage AmM-1 TaxID=1503929 RepID=UPI00054088BA|nr:baseplate hub [Aurantimonas phage AmM-1]BAP94483.1 tail protein [Aurantimonas phage AmM-1]